MRGPLEWRAKKEAEKQKSARRGSLSVCVYSPDHASVFGTRVFLGSHRDGSIHSPGEDSLAARHEREEEVLCGKRSYLSMLFCSSTFIGLFPVD